MSRTYIPEDLRQFVVDRANGKCEYCFSDQINAIYSHEVDHIISEKHGGITEESNLAFACFDCNRNKGSDIAEIDPKTGKLSGLYNPRLENWDDHFKVNGYFIEGKTSKGRATAELLKMNDPQKIDERIETQQKAQQEENTIDQFEGQKALQEDLKTETRSSESNTEDQEYDYSHGYGY